MAFKKYLRKTAKSAKKFVKQRYGLNKRSKGANLGQMASDVLMLKTMINAEKKSYQATFATQTVGQVYQNNSGISCLDITPYIAQGAGTDQRTGASLKLHSGLYQFQFNQQTALTTSQHLIIEFWIVKGTQLTSAIVQDYLFSTSTFSGVIDTNSPRNQDRFSDFQLVRRVHKRLAPDQITGDGTTLTFDVPIKFNRGKGHHLRLVPSPTGVSSDCLNGQMFMTVRADVGNRDTVFPSTRSVPLIAVNTGSNMRFAYKVWYYDN